MLNLNRMLFLCMGVCLSFGSYAHVQAVGCSITLNADGSFTQYGCSTRGSDTFQVYSGKLIELSGSVKAITCAVTHVADNITPGFFNNQYFSSSSRTSVSTFRINLLAKRGEIHIPNGTHMFDVSFKNKKWDFANSELQCSLVK